MRVVNINSTHTFEQQVGGGTASGNCHLASHSRAPHSSHFFMPPRLQVATFAECDLMVSVHGSQNANLMFMRRGAAFMEINPFKFLYREPQP